MVLLQKKKKISNGLPDIRFYLSTRKREERHQCVVCGEVLANNSFNARNLCMHLPTKHESHANKPLQFFLKKTTRNL
jgi:hypothetical protein